MTCWFVVVFPQCSVVLFPMFSWMRLFGHQQWGNSAVTELPHELWEQPRVHLQHTSAGWERNQHFSQNLPSHPGGHSEGISMCSFRVEKNNGNFINIVIFVNITRSGYSDMDIWYKGSILYEVKDENSPLKINFIYLMSFQTCVTFLSREEKMYF